MLPAIFALSVTRFAGLAAYAASLLACLARRWRAGPGRSAPFGVIAVVQLILGCDIAFDLRWKLHGLFMQAAKDHGVYTLRRAPQVAALAGIACLTAACAVLVARRWRGRPGAAIAAVSTMLAAVLHLTEMVSYHGVDRVLYAYAGSIMYVALLWIGLALVTCAGALIDCG